MADADKVEWACPKCGAEPEKHGKGGKEKCLSEYETTCYGFVCECLDNGVEGADTEEHGTALADPCRWAACHHCGWGGTFPPRPKRLPPWARKALDAGWSPPKGWAP